MISSGGSSRWLPTKGNCLPKLSLAECRPERVPGKIAILVTNPACDLETALGTIKDFSDTVNFVVFQILSNSFWTGGDGSSAGSRYFTTHWSSATWKVVF